MNTRILIPLVLTLAAAFPPAAHAGTYVVVGCSDLGGGTIRPANGWYLAAGGYPSRNACATRGGLYATTSRAPALFRFDAPSGTTIARLVSTYRAHLSGAAPWAVPTLVAEAGHGGEWEYIPPAQGSINPWPVELANGRASGSARGGDAVRIGVRCEIVGPCTTGGQPWASFRSVAVELSDARPPAAGLTAPAGHLHGSVGIDLTARDEGGGVYERALDLDGRRLTTARLCTTVVATLGAQRHFTSPVPCPLDTAVTVPLDTRKLTEGAHALTARAEDVAGNARTAASRIVVDNLPPRAGRVTLTGEPSEALTAQPNGFRGEDVTYEYRWERCAAACTEIGGAVERTYPARSRDAGYRLRAVVAATDGGGTVRVASAPSAVVPSPASTPTAVPHPSEPQGRITAWLEPGRRPRGRGWSSSRGHDATVARPASGDGWGLSAAAIRAATGDGWGLSAAAIRAATGDGRGLSATAIRAASGGRRVRHTTVTWPARVRIRGRLTDLAGRPLARRPVRMLERIAGGRWRAITGVRTRRDGRLTTFTRIGPSRRIRLAFGRASTTLRLTVRASVRVRVRHRGSVTYVSGRVGGGRIPRAGLRVLLQTRGFAGWRTRAVLRTDGLGRFAASGRAPRGARLRIAVPAQRGYPYARGVGR